MLDNGANINSVNNFFDYDEELLLKIENKIYNYINKYNYINQYIMLGDQRFELDGIIYNDNKFGDHELHLRNYGYAIKKSNDERRTAMDAACKDYGTSAVLQRLNVVRNYQSKPENRKIFDDDIEYMEKLNAIAWQQGEIAPSDQPVTWQQGEIAPSDQPVTWQQDEFAQCNESTVEQEVPANFKYQNNDNFQFNYHDNNYNISLTTDKLNDNYDIVKMLCNHIITSNNIKTKHMMLTNEYMRLRIELNKSHANPMY